MTDRQALAELLRPHCAAILERVADEAYLAGDQTQLPSLAELRIVLDRGAERALRAIAMPAGERRVELRALADAGRGALDRLSVPAIARIGLSRIGLRHARATVERAVHDRADGEALQREFAVFEEDLIAVLQDASLVVERLDHAAKLPGGVAERRRMRPS